MDVQSIFIFIFWLLQFKHDARELIIQQQQYHNDVMNDSSNNEIRKFQCSKCAKSSLVLKKVWDQQHHGFACDKCWTDIEGQRRYKCIVQ
jgi:hypothetical protein